VQGTWTAADGKMASGRGELGQQREANQAGGTRGTGRERKGNQAGDSGEPAGGGTSVRRGGHEVRGESPVGRALYFQKIG
jgi:hypothetical protein